MPLPIYQSYNVRNFTEIPQLAQLPESEIKAIRVVSQVLPFKTNNYVVEELIDWSRAPDDPIYTLNFPRHQLLSPAHFRRMEKAVNFGDEERIKKQAREIQLQLNPNPSGQSANVPSLGERRIPGAQHKYRETVLFFPSAGQTCHAYCTFCFRWPQFSGLSEAKFRGHEIESLTAYIARHRRVTDLLFTGGDPLTMKADVLRAHIEPFLDPRLDHLKSIRLGSKVLAYWPYRFISDPDADDLLRVFEKVAAAGKNLAFMAHFNHPRELGTPSVRKAIRRLRSAGVQIRTQSPLLKHINDVPELWSEMWRKQVDLGCVPYYMFVERDTGAKHFFALPLNQCWQIFQKAYQRVSGLCRTVRGPIMSATPGKVQILGEADVKGERVFCLQFIQGRNADWCAKPFFAKFDAKATWLNWLTPAFGETEFFYEEELRQIMALRDPSGYGLHGLAVRRHSAQPKPARLEIEEHAFEPDAAA